MRQVADVQFGHRAGFAFELGVDASHDFQERGLTRTVEAEHTDLGARKKDNEMFFRISRFGGTTLPNRCMVKTY